MAKGDAIMGGVFQRLFLSVAVAAAVAFVGATPLAQAAGFYKENPNYSTENAPILSFSGAILFALTVALIGPMLRLIGTTVATLKHAQSRPAPVVSITLIGCGTLCVVVSLWLAWSAKGMRPDAEFAQAMQAMAQQTNQTIQQTTRNTPNMGSANINWTITPQVTMKIDPPAQSAGPMILTILAFLLGSSLIAVGVWGSIDPTAGSRAISHNGVMKPAAPELAEMPA